MAGLLDVFTIGFNSEGLKDFETNLKNTEKELDKTDKEITKLKRKFDELSDSEGENAGELNRLDKEINQATEKSKELTKTLEQMKSSGENSLLSLKKNFTNLVRTVGMLAIAGTAIKKSLEFYEEGEQLDFLAQKTDIAVDKLQLLANVVKKYGGTTEGIAGTLEGLNTKEGRQTAAKSGISISDDSEKNLENIARKMETLRTNAEKLKLAKTLGLDEATTRMVIEGTTKLNEQLKRAKKYQLFTPEDIQRMREYRQIESDIRLGIENIFGSIWRMLLPAITTVAKAVRSVTDWLAEHEGAVKIIAALVGVTVAIAGIVSVVQLLNAAIALVMANPVVLIILAIAVAITALIAIINDLIVFMQGGDSVIEELFKKWGYDTDLMREDLNNLFTSIKNWINSATQWLQSLGSKFTELGQKIKALWEMIPEPLRKMMVGGWKFSAALNPMTAPIVLGQAALSRYKKNELNAVPPGSVANYNQTQSINNSNAANTQSINQNNNSNVRSLNNARTSNKNVNIQKVEINTQGADGQSIYNQFLDAASGLDNGMRA